MPRQPRNRYFTITNSMLDAGQAAMANCTALGATPRTTCHIVFQAMLDAADVHPGLPRERPSLYPAYWLDGKRLPKRIYHPDRIPRDVIVSRYWYLRDCYRKELKRFLEDSKKSAGIEFYS